MVFQDPNCLLCDCIIRSMSDNVQVILVHENDPNEGGCEFWQIMEKTPEQLKTKPYSIYSNDIAVSLYSIEEYQRTSLRQLLAKMGANPTGTRSILDAIGMRGTKMKLRFAKCFA